ncbi:MAG: Stf0 family sulfotransferase [Pseudomonadota bacterium]
MLGGIDTGYEPGFDFPPGGRPTSLFYMIATLPRTGSTWLSHLLWGTGCLGAPLEYLNFDAEGPYGFAANDAAAQQRLWGEALDRRTSPNGVFGVKCFPVQLQTLAGTNPQLLSAVMSGVLTGRVPRRIVYLLRRDRAAHIASFARAAMSGVWREEQEAGLARPLDYSQEALDSVGQGIDLMASVWEAMFRDLRIDPLRLWYEDVVARPAEAAAQVAAYLGIPLDPAAAVPVPEIRKQTGAEIGDWAQRYAQSKADPS